MWLISLSTSKEKKKKDLLLQLNADKNGVNREGPCTVWSWIAVMGEFPPAEKNKNKTINTLRYLELLCSSYRWPRRQNENLTSLAPVWNSRLPARDPVRACVPADRRSRRAQLLGCAGVSLQTNGCCRGLPCHYSIYAARRAAVFIACQTRRLTEGDERFAL